MIYEHDELELIAEALQQMADKTPAKSKKGKRIEALADKVVADQSNKAWA